MQVIRLTISNLVIRDGLIGVRLPDRMLTKIIIMHHSMQKTIYRIIAMHAGKGCTERRIEGLRRKGYKVSYEGTRLNFGSTGTIKGDLVQLGCATGKRAKNGYHYNSCPVYSVTK